MAKKETESPRIAYHETAIRWPFCKATDGLVEVQALRSVPAIRESRRRFTRVRALPGDSRVDALERIWGLDGEVAAQYEARV